MNVSKISTHNPTLDEVSKVLSDGLKSNFTNVEVSVVECPDLTEAPFHLSSAGLCGNPRLADIGGQSFLFPLPQKNKIYHLRKIAELCEIPNSFMIGAGAGPAHLLGVNSELINNITLLGDGGVVNKAYTAKVDKQTDGCVLERLTSEEFCLMGNFLVSEGKPGKVIEVKASKRHGKNDFVQSLQTSLTTNYGDKPVALGGVFLVETGTTRMHVMRDFCTMPITSHKAVDDWLMFYDVSPTLVCVGELVSHDPGFDLRTQHFHGFTMHGQGGHYHWDTTPDEVQYRGYFIVAEHIYRIDQPSTPMPF